ncbi:MAG: hybrid sensor histidine kinase/response regulator [Planctomycetia bacterium]|nr:hybrid sensor histidine kinase/response regulator [Planctomycetia bacterium]
MEDLSGFSMLELFRLEADTQTAVLSAAVLAIEEVEHSPTAIESMMRAAHSLKGAARIIGLDSAVRVAHAMEEVFVAAGKGLFKVGPEHADVLLAGTDFLGSIARADDALHPGGPWTDRANQLVSRLTVLLGTPSSSPLPSQPTRPGTEAQAQAPAPPHGAVQPHGAIAADGPAAPAAAAFDQFDRVVRVSADSLTRLVGLAGESLVEARQLRPFVDSLLALRTTQARLCDTIAALDERIDRGSLDDAALRDGVRHILREQATAVLAGLTRRCEEFESFASRTEDLSSRLHHEVLASRMRPLADGIRGFPRLVRDVSRSLGKQVRLEVRGEQTGVDRDILEKLEAPLSHLIRNALDHGIEQSDRREAAGKPPVGTILLDARHRAGMLQITVTDDGDGIDIGHLKSRAVTLGLVSPQVADQLSAAELLEFLFLPGFSTKSVVSEISGRGVGLDVVQSMTKAVGGSVRVATQTGRQTVFTLQLPITMSVIRALLVDIVGEPYAFPLTRIDQILSCRRDDIRTVEGRQYVDRDGVAIGLVLAAQVLDLNVSAVPVADDALSVVVISDRGKQFGMIVTAFLGERDLEVRPLDPRLGKVPDINSASLLENGDPVLIVDVDDLVRSIDGLLMGRRLTQVEFARMAEQARRRKRILVVDDSITVRELERQLLQSRGFDVDVAVDGMDGWNAIRGGQYDLVVSDVDMPRLDGIGLVSLIKADPARRDIPIVIVSYKDREEDRLRGLEAGANRYLTKTSFHDQTFLNTIIDLIGEPTD